MKAVLLLVLLCLGVIFAANPGFKARVTPNGLNYANKIAMSALSASVRKLKIPDQSGKSGRVSYSVTGMRITSFTTPGSTMQMSANGIKWRASGLGISVSGRCHYKYKKGWFKISDSVNLDVSLSGVSFDITLSLKNAAGKPRLSGSGCNCAIGKVKVKFHGGKAWIYNLFSKFIAGKIKKMLQGQMCQLIQKAINTDANNQLAKLPMNVVIEKKFMLDYSLSSNPSFNNGKYLETFHKGEVFWKGDKKECPYSPSPFPANRDTSRMLYLWVSEYMGNSLAYSGFQHGFLRYNLTAKDLPAGNRSLLNTTCTGMKCIGVLIPQIGQKYPNSKVMFQMYATSAPQIKITSGVITMNFSGNVDMYAQTPKGTTPFLLTMTCNFLTSVTASIQGQLVKGKITSTKLTVGVKNSKVGPVVTPILQLVMNAAIDGFVVPKLNAEGQKGLVLPVTANIRFSKAQLSLLQNAILIATDLTYLSDEELAREKASENSVLPEVVPYLHNREMSFNVIGQKNIFDQI